MKKILIILFACLLLVGCGSKGVTQEEYDKVVAERDEYKEKYESILAINGENKVEIQADEIPKEFVDSEKQNKGLNVEILAEYTLSDGIGWYTRHFMVLKNNSDVTVDIATSSIAYDKEDNIVGASDSKFLALGPGCTSILYEAFETEEVIERYDTNIKTNESEYYESVIQDLEYVQNDIEGGAVFQVTNNGEKAAEFVEGYALYFLNDELVGFETNYFTDDDSEIKPNETISKQFKCYQQFDVIEFYLTGRR